MTTTTNALAGGAEIPTREQLEEQIRGLPERWLPRAEQLHGWAARWLEAWNTHDLDALCGLVAPDVVWEDPAMFGAIVESRAEFRAFTEDLLRGLPDVRFELAGPLYLASEGGGIGVPWRMTGTFTGELRWWEKRYGENPPAFAPTARGVDLEGIDLYELRDGLLARWTIRYDLFELSRQLGLLPEPSGAAARLLGWGQRATAPLLRRRSRRP